MGKIDCSVISQYGYLETLGFALMIRRPIYGLNQININRKNLSLYAFIRVLLSRLGCFPAMATWGGGVLPQTYKNTQGG